MDFSRLTCCLPTKTGVNGVGKGMQQQVAVGFLLEVKGLTPPRRKLLWSLYTQRLPLPFKFILHTSNFLLLSFVIHIYSLFVL